MVFRFDYLYNESQSNIVEAVLEKGSLREKLGLGYQLFKIPVVVFYRIFEEN